ncbi:MAG: hypothetical protein FE834_06980, partial [Gammaproteobacteria bacterium]|nr:hypothetical protein [Gammaproteobacteria bacterium]
DLIVGAYGANSKVGKTYVVFGKNNTDAINLSAITSGTGGFVINGEGLNDWSGWSVSSAGDVNGDGLDDVIVGATNVNVGKGRSYVVFGKKDDTSAINLGVITSGTGGFAINGDARVDGSGYSVSSAGDVNGDGLDDLIVGTDDTQFNDKAQIGKSYVVFGKTNGTAINLGDIARGTGGFIINGETTTNNSDTSVSSAGDVNGDGLDDLIVRTHSVDSDNNNGFSNESGKSYVVFGKIDTDVINLSAIASGTGGFAINGEKASDKNVFSVSYAGDVNGDGLDDVIVGARLDNGGKGASYVVFGKTDNTAVNLGTIARGTGGFVINGEKTGDNSGYSVSAAGDINSDGLDDLIVGADSANGGKGKSYVIFGKTDTKAINLSALGDDSKYIIDHQG